MVKSALPLRERTFEKDFEPTGDYVLLRCHREGESAGGIALPEGAQMTPQKATVLKVGPGELREDGSRGPVDVKPGEVVYPVFQGIRQPIALKIGDVQYVVVQSHAIVGKSKSGNASSGDQNGDS